MKKRNIIVIALPVLLTIFAWRQVYLHHYEPSDFFGTWKAVECVGENKIQRTDFTPEKYIGHCIYIAEDTYYMDFWEGILPPEKVVAWTIGEIDLEQYFILAHCERPFPVSGEKCAALERITTYGSTLDLGFIIDRNTMICPTSSGWYRYEKQ